VVLTVLDIMQRLHLTRDTVLQEIRHGNLKAKKFGNRGGYRIRIGDYRAWLAPDQKGQEEHGNG